MKCKFIKKNGIQCNANKMLGSDYCFSHNPEVSIEKNNAIIKGARAPKSHKRAKKLEPFTIGSPRDIVSLLENTINQVRTDPITHQKANCIGYLANIALKALDQSDVEIRLGMLEKQILEISKKV